MEKKVSKDSAPSTTLVILVIFVYFWIFYWTKGSKGLGQNLLIEGSLLTKYSHAHQYEIQHSNFDSSEFPTNDHWDHQHNNDHNCGYNYDGDDNLWFIWKAVRGNVLCQYHFFQLEMEKGLYLVPKCTWKDTAEGRWFPCVLEILCSAIYFKI